MKRLLFLFLALVVVTARAADVTMSAAEFTRAFTRSLQDSAPGYKVRPTRELQVVVTDPDGAESTVFLYDAYAEYLKTPGNKDKIMRQNSLGVVATKDEMFKLDPTRIVPVVKPRGWLADVKASAKAKGAASVPDLVYDELNDDLIIAYAEDTPNTFRYVTPAQLEEINLGRSDLRAQAVENLQNILKSVQVRPSRLVMNVKADGNYEASLLAVPDFWTKRQAEVDGELVVAVPARDYLLITGSKNAAGLAKMREIVARVARESPHKLTDKLFVYRDGRFVEFKE